MKSKWLGLILVSLIGIAVTVIFKQNESIQVSDASDNVKELIVKNKVKKDKPVVNSELSRSLDEEQAAINRQVILSDSSQKLVKDTSLVELLSEEHTPVESYFQAVQFREPSEEEKINAEKMLAFERREQESLLKGFLLVIEKEISVFNAALEKPSESQKDNLVTQARNRLKQLELIQADIENELAELSI